LSPPSLLDRVDLLAADVGRLRRRVEPESSLAHLVDRIGRHVETLDLMLRPCAAALAPELFGICGDEALAIDEALAWVDARARTMRSLLGIREAA
jgi:hypothetical protein